MLYPQCWGEGSYTGPLAKRHCVIELAQVSWRLMARFESKRLALPLNSPSGHQLKHYRMTDIHIELPLCVSDSVGTCPSMTHSATFYTNAKYIITLSLELKVHVRRCVWVFKVYARAYVRSCLHVCIQSTCVSVWKCFLGTAVTDLHLCQAFLKKPDRQREVEMQRPSGVPTCGIQYLWRDTCK